MIEITGNIGLKKESEDEFYNVNTTNENLDKIDTAIGSKQDASTAITTDNIGAQSVNYATSSGTAQYAESSNEAVSAAKATQDGKGNNIAETYEKKEWTLVGTAKTGGESVVFHVTGSSYNGTHPEFLIVIYNSMYFDTVYIPYDIFCDTIVSGSGEAEFDIEPPEDKIYPGSKVTVSFSRGYFSIKNDMRDGLLAVYEKKY